MPIPGLPASLVVGWWLACVGVVPLLLVVCAALTAREGGARAWVGSAEIVLSTRYWLPPTAAEVGRPAVHTGLSGDSLAFHMLDRQLAWRASTYRGTIAVDVPIGSVPSTSG